ncbi:MAG: hypothetical protein DCF25_18555 [Leptolyngbya foveolarum]|uniref:Uncharacterized protein n=1 Tax=Leptolyngbya foveolarum TaxID=47253 RepID=A0A2W4TSI4_9CYAN|nr:MAG: hypothetical protein DCF25_18555 [Leptolyngbya foveolarum]
MNKPRGLIQTSSALLLLLLGAALLIMPEQVLSQAPALKSAPSSSPVFEDVPVPEVENQVPTLLPTSGVVQARVTLLGRHQSFKVRLNQLLKDFFQTQSVTLAKPNLNHALSLPGAISGGSFLIH